MASAVAGCVTSKWARNETPHKKEPQCSYNIYMCVKMYYRKWAWFDTCQALVMGGGEERASSALCGRRDGGRGERPSKPKQQTNKQARHCSVRSEEGGDGGGKYKKKQETNQTNKQTSSTLCGCKGVGKKVMLGRNQRRRQMWPSQTRSLDSNGGVERNGRRKSKPWGVVMVVTCHILQEAWQLLR